MRSEVTVYRILEIERPGKIQKYGLISAFQDAKKDIFLIMLRK